MHMWLYVPLSHWGCTHLVKTMFLYFVLLIQVIHTDTYSYIEVHAIHTETCTYIHKHTPGLQCRKGLLSCCGGSTLLLCAALPTQIISDGARGGLAERQVRAEGPWAAQGVRFGPPDACCARGCAKTGPGVGQVGRVPGSGIKWSGSCPGVPWMGSVGCRPSGGSFGDAVKASVLDVFSEHPAQIACMCMYFNAYVYVWYRYFNAYVYVSVCIVCIVYISPD